MMEETANPNPSNATLAPEMPAAFGEPKATTTSIKLLIKASNQQHDDQIIESDLMWTVHRLKTQLSLVYPSKPPVSEQKLIYSGQLLNDCAQLKDVIRSYKDVYTQNHILHLVYTPKNQHLKQQNSTKMTTPNNNTDGLRQRQNVAQNSSTSSTGSNINTNSNANATSQQSNRQQLSSPASNYGFLSAEMQQQQQQGVTNNAVNANTNDCNRPFAGDFNMQNMANQQAAMYNWMWQTYMQYMQQFQNISGAQIPIPNSPNNSTSPSTPFNPVIPFPSYAPASFYSQPYLSQQQNQIPSPPPPPSSSSNGAAQSSQREALQDPQPQNQQEQEPAEAAPPQPRFLNIVQEEQENRDWLDSFFSIMRLALFLTILYFNSSAIRCLMVFLIGGGIYLYHIGFFRSRQERNNNDINRNNNAAAAGPAQQQQQQQPQGGQEHNQAGGDDVNPPQNEDNNAADAVAAAATAAVSSTTPSTSDVGDAASTAAQDAAAAVDRNSTSVIAFMRSFIVSFFTSLLPETPAAL